MDASPRVLVIIASKGRPADVARLLPYLKRLRGNVDCLLSVTSPADLPDVDLSDVTVIQGPAGSSVQRNAGIDWAGTRYSFLVFFDDDFAPELTWIETMVALLYQNPNLASATGKVLHDGMVTPGVTWDDVPMLIDNSPITGESQPTYTCVENPFGGHMIVRTEALQGCRFDERLPLYGWLEDLDMGGQLRRKGWDIGCCPQARGVHILSLIHI